MAGARRDLSGGGPAYNLDELSPSSLMRFPLPLALLLVSMAPLAVVAQVQLSRLDGVVLDAAGRPVAGVDVTVSDPLGATVRRATTDPSGRFLIVDLAPGRYRLAVDGGGAATSPVPLAIADGLPASVTLHVPPAFRDAVVVESARPAASIATRTSLGAESIARTPGRAGSRRLQDVVATLPGWATEDNGLLHSRGVDDGFLYVVDGVPVYERLDQASGLAPDASTLEALSVVTGYVPPEYGYKAGGVIDVRTRAASDAWRGLAAIGGGSDAAADGEGMAGGALGRGTALWLHAAGQRSSRFLDPVHPDNLHNGGGGLTTAGQLTAGSGARDRVTASWSAGAARFDVPSTDAQDAAGQDQRLRLAQGGGTASWQRGWSSATVSQLAGYVRRNRSRLDPSDFDTPLTAHADRRLTRIGALAGVTHQAGAHVIKTGAEIQQLRLAEGFGFAVTDEDAAEAAGLSDAALAFDAGHPFRFDGQARSWLYSAYAQDTWQATTALTLAAGVRFDRTRLLLPRQQWSPRAGVAFAASPRTTLRASVSRFYQPPQPEFLLLASSPEARALSPFIDDGGAAADGGADIEPERQWAFEGGVEHRMGRGWRVDLSYWQRHVDQYADPNVFVGTTILVPNAVAEGRAQGVDARLEVAPGGAWSGYGNVSVGKVTQTGPITGGLFLDDDVADLGPGVEFVPDHDQRVVASAGVTWTGPRGATLSATGRYESGTPIELDDEGEAADLAARPGADRVDFDRGRVKPRTVVSLVGSVPVWRTAGADLSLRASVLNLFDASYAYNFGNPFSGTHFGAPRTFALGVRLEAR
jgi:outer membrane receptor protein involved in Fe transport